MTPADRLLLSLVGGRPAEAISTLGALVSWPRLYDQSEAHGVAPLVARALDTLGWPGVPRDVRRAFEAARRINAARNLLVARALARVLDALAQAAVPVIPLKGVALAESLYGDPALRVSSDIDILVPRPCVARAWSAIIGLGYARAEQEEDVGAGDIEVLLESNIEYAFVSPEPPRCPLELHWDIAWRWPRDAPALADLWAEARPRPYRGIAAWALGREWELLYLAVHAARHRWQTLKWLVDVHEICRRGGLDWARLEDKAARFDLAEVLEITLGVTRALLDTSLPPGVGRHPLPPWLDVFPAAPRSLDIWRGALYPARLFARPSHKLAYLARVLLVPTLAERRWVRLPARLGALYYPLRPLRLAGRWAKGLTSLRDREDHRGSVRRLAP